MNAPTAHPPTWQRRLRHGFFFVLNHTLNPLTRRLGGAPFGPIATIQHVGRRSGKPYETPIMVAPLPDGFVIELTYGPNVDWHKNVLAGGGALVWHGRKYVIQHLAPLPADVGRAAFPAPARLILRLLRRTHFEKLVSTTTNITEHVSV